MKTMIKEVKLELKDEGLNEMLDVIDKAKKAKLIFFPTLDNDIHIIVGNMVTDQKRGKVSEFIVKTRNKHKMVNTMNYLFETVCDSNLRVFNSIMEGLELECVVRNVDKQKILDKIKEDLK